jgi:hypothetical protein
MDMHPWTTYEIAAARHEERMLRAMSAYKALRGADPGADDVLVPSRRSRLGILDRLLRREVGAAPRATSPAS